MALPKENEKESAGERRWFVTLSDALVRAHPFPGITHAFTLMTTNQLEAAEARLQDAARCIEANTPCRPGPDHPGTGSYQSCDYARYSGDLARFGSIATLPPGSLCFRGTLAESPPDFLAIKAL